jgi:hypothetical protein
MRLSWAEVSGPHFNGGRRGKPEKKIVDSRSGETQKRCRVSILSVALRTGERSSLL